MKSLVSTFLVSALVAPFAQADDTCAYDGFKDAWDNNDATCYSGSYKPWPTSEASASGDCLADVGIGTRSCEIRASTVCTGQFNSASCRNDCVLFHIKCCCSPLYPTSSPVTPTKKPTVKLTPRPTIKNVAPALAPTTRTPTAAPTVSQVPSEIPTLSLEPSVVPSEEPSPVPTTELPTVTPTISPTSAPTTTPFISCPWQDFTGFKADCVNYDTEIEGDDSLCYFSSEQKRTWDSSGKFEGETNPFKFCTKNAVQFCDVYDWWNNGSQCNSLCVNFHSLCCCHPKTAIPTKAPTS